jgi:hypothetical protein
MRIRNMLDRESRPMKYLNKCQRDVSSFVIAISRASYSDSCSKSLSITGAYLTMTEFINHMPLEKNNDDKI